MDWEKEYQRSKASSSRPGPSNTRKSALLDDDEDDDMNGVAAAPLPRSISNRGRGLFDETREETPLEQLMRHWMNERNSPDILPAQEGLLGSLLDHIRRQTDTVQLLRGDPSSSEEEHIRIMLVQTEVERIKFIVRSYVRTRLFKIEKYARFITSNKDIQSRITTAERDYASRHAHLTDRHFYHSVLQSLPDAQKALDDQPVFMPPMVTEPDKTKFVFVHALRDGQACQLPNGRVLELPKGNISSVPFFCIEPLLESGDVELV